MAIFKSIVAGLLALLLALPSPSLCYADVVAGERSNYVQETQETGQRSPEEQEDHQESDQSSSTGQRSDSSGATGESSGDGAPLSVSSNADNEEGLTNGNLDNNAATRSNGFDPSVYPSEYSDPSINSYLGYSRDDLQEALKSFSDLSDIRSLTDQENYQATLALFAWYYLDYGTTDDLVKAAVSSDWLLSAIVGIMGFSTKDLAYTIIYSLFGTPGSWGANAPYDVYSVKGIAWYIANIDSKASSIYSRIGQVIDRLDTSNGYLSGIQGYGKNTVSRLDQVVDRLNTVNGFLSGIESSTAGTVSRLDQVVDRLNTSNGFLSGVESSTAGTVQRLIQVIDRLDTVNGFLSGIESSTAGTVSRLDQVVDRLNTSNGFLKGIESELFDNSTKRPWLQVIGDRITAFMYQLDVSQKDISIKLDALDSLAKDETVSSNINSLHADLLRWLLGNNNGLPNHTEYIDHGLIYYIDLIHEDNQSFFDKALEYFEYFKDRLFYIEYDLVDYGMDIEPGFNRVIEAINTKQFDIQLENAAVNINLSGIESRLDTIITMLGIAGAKDLLETFLGDFNFDVSSALAASISSAMQNVFPFCIPAILKQCLGLMQADASAPVFEFDIFGAPLVLDFTAQGLCDISQVTSWFCRISFLILLLVNTKKFIFTINRGAQDA